MENKTLQIQSNQRDTDFRMDLQMRQAKSNACNDSQKWDFIEFSHT